MNRPLQQIIADYQPDIPLERAETIPAAWYTDPRIAALENRSVFGGTWQMVARLDQLCEPGRYVTADVAGEPVVVVRDGAGSLRAFFNVCRHHAAAVMTQPEGSCTVMQCPYHAWTYALDGSLKGMPEWDGVQDFDKRQNGLVPIAVDTWENFVFVNLSAPPAPALSAHSPLASPATPPLAKGGPGLVEGRAAVPTLAEFLGDLPQRVAPLKLGELKFFERRSWDINCNWKVYVDNYLDGGYHVPHLHKGLSSVLDYQEYKIETHGHYCLQHSPMTAGKDADTASVRKGDTAYYYWLHPNFMFNWYEGVMDTNLVLPLGVDRCRVIFDFYFADVGEAALDHNRRSTAVAERVQQEDIDICESVQRGLGARVYNTGRLSVRREAGEQQFHRLLYRDLSKALAEVAGG